MASGLRDGPGDEPQGEPQDQALDGVRVVDLSTDVAGAFAAKWFATYGADVIKVEPPGGDPTRRAPPVAGESPDHGMLFAYLNTGKRSAVLDLDDASERDAVLRLLETADVVIESFAPGELAARGIDLDALTEARAQLVVCSITPYGQSGPRAGWRATSLTAFAAGGQMMICGDPEEPPLVTAGHQAYYQAGLHGFAASVTALYAARTTGAGERIDISIQEVQASSLEGAGPGAMSRGTDLGRMGNRARAVWGIYPCKDGHVGVAAMARQVPTVYECIGHPELSEDPQFAGWAPDPDRDALVSALITEWTAARTSREIYEQSARIRAPFSVIPGPRELLEWPPLVESGFWHEVDHPVLGRHALPSAPVEIAGGRGTQRRAPLLGEHTGEVLDEIAAPPGGAPQPYVDRRPLLDGVCVLDVTQVWAGPFATRLLADMGAEVIHIEGPAFPDAVRTLAALPPDAERRYNRSAYFNEYNRNKLGLTLDLASAEGLAAFRRMVAKADVVIENWSSGVAQRLGLGYEQLCAINPRIIAVSMPGFGHSGAEAQRVGFGPGIEQMGGLVALQGYEGGPPHKSGISYGDPLAGIATAGAVAMALLRRERTGEGCYVMVVQRDNVIGLIGEYMVAESLGRPLPVRTGNRHQRYAPHNVYRTRDDAGRFARGLDGTVLREFNDTWLAVAVDGDAAWHGLRSVVGDARLDDPRFKSEQGRRAAVEEIDAVIGEWARDRDPEEAAEDLQHAGVPAAPVLSPLMTVRDAHLNDRGFYVQCDHPDAGPHLTTRPVWRLARRPFESLRCAPCFGEHNHDVLSRVGGYSDEEMDALERTGVIAGEPRVG